MISPKSKVQGPKSGRRFPRVGPETAPVGNSQRGRNAGFIRQKAALDTVLPDKSGVPAAESGCTRLPRTWTLGLL
jgi:hypothetical protein